MFYIICIPYNSVIAMSIKYDLETFFFVLSGIVVKYIFNFIQVNNFIDSISMSIGRLLTYLSRVPKKLQIICI